MTNCVSEAEIDAAAKIYCCPEWDCILAADYCAIRTERENIRQMLEAAAAVRALGEPAEPAEPKREWRPPLFLDQAG
jgi:hypothetical protein